MIAWVAIFLAVVGVITLRDTRGYALGREVSALEDSLLVLRDVSTNLSRDLARMLSPGELRRRGRALGLRLPSDSELRTLKVPRR